MFSFTCLFICFLYKQLGNQRLSPCHVEYWTIIKSFILLALNKTTREIRQILAFQSCEDWSYFMWYREYQH